MAAVDVPLYWGRNGATPRFSTRQRSLSVASGLSSRATVKAAAAARRPKLSVLYDFRRSYSLRKKAQIHLETLTSEVYNIKFKA